MKTQPVSCMSFAKRLVLDTSTLISAAVRPTSTPSQTFRTALAELQTVLSRPRFARYLSHDDQVRFLAIYTRAAKRYAITQTIAAGRDPKDDKFLSLAVSCQADFIVSSDQDLLILNPFMNIPVLNAADFLQSADSRA